MIAASIWATGIAVVVSQTANAFVAVLFAWQGSVYASAPFMSWLNQHTELSAQLELAQRALPLAEDAQQLEEKNAQRGIGGPLANALLQQLERPGRVALGNKLLGGCRAHHADKTSSENDVDAPLRPEPCWRLYSTSILVKARPTVSVGAPFSSTSRSTVTTRARASVMM